MRKNLSLILSLAAVLLIAAVLRIHTFYLPHNRGDQPLYLALAMKLDKYGLERYNLKNVDLLVNGDFRAVAESPNQIGSLLVVMEKSNIFYYSKQPLSNMPPAFSVLLMISHKIFASEKPYMYFSSELGSRAIALRPKLFLDQQFYAVWINFVFSLLFILAVFFLGKMFFDQHCFDKLLVVANPE